MFLLYLEIFFWYKIIFGYFWKEIKNYFLYRMYLYEF